MPTGRVRTALGGVVSDTTPLRESPAFRRLFIGQAISSMGTQVTQVAVALQVYEITHSSLDVGLVGLAALGPLIVFGLYGGAIADAVDRRRLVFITSTGEMVASAALLALALSRTERVAGLFVCVAVQAGFSAVSSPTRRAIIPQLVRPELLQAANTLNYGVSSLAVIVGPLVAGVSVSTGGYSWAYAIDVASFAGAFYAAARLPRLAPAADARPAGLSSVVEGLRFIMTRRVVLMTFVYDIAAMLFGAPRALIPALSHTLYHGGAGIAGLLYAAPSVGALLATILGGAIGRVHRHGLGVALAIATWGLAVAVFGLVSTLWVGLLMLAIAGAADTVSAVYRSTILQVSTPDAMQGRLQGVFIVVVTGGPRLGDIESGLVASAFDARFAVVSGGVACVAAVGVLALLVPSFLRYDSRQALAEVNRSSE
ncbi:MAG: major facilitator superfamily 1 [Ilumatobacteraceae bacterium]|nr:major facilitator superfamily 1 [Ilumatobacteraceae bacterium]